MSILAFLEPKFKKICSKFHIFKEIIKQIRLIDHYFHFKMTFECKYDLKHSIFHELTGIFAIFLEINHT